MRVFVTGARGQLGRALLARLGAATVSTGDLPEWDLLNAGQVVSSICDFKPDLVIHAGAMTAVDYAAEHPEEAVQVNGVGSYNVALACQQAGALCLGISTNEVFDGESRRPYQEYDVRGPINPYGYSKYVGEQAIERIAPEYMIVRTAWLYAAGGSNFIHKIIARARSGEPLRVVTDEVGSPTYVEDLADAILALAQTGRPGIYHLTNEGYCSRYEFAREILRQAGLDAAIEPITSDSFRRASTPPKFAPLANLFAAAAGVRLRAWQEALAAFLADQGTGT